MSAILPARSLPIPGSSDRSRSGLQQASRRFGQAFDLARGTAIGAHAKLVLALDLEEFGGLVEHRRDFGILHRHVGTHERPDLPRKYRTARRVGIDSDQGQFLKGADSYTGEAGAAKMGAHMIAGDTDVLIVIDVQNDFCPGGRLPVPGGSDVVPVINRLAGRFANIVVTQDWHPHDHFSFASMHPGKQPNDIIAAPYGPQMLWPDHCVQGTSGAQFHESLCVPQATIILRKGFHRTINLYSAFYENDRQTPTGLIGYLRERSLTRVFLAGLAYDFCVRYSAEDARRAGFSVLVIEDACRSIDVGGSAEAARSAFQNLGIQSIAAGDFA